MPGSAMIGNLAVDLTLETAAFQRGATIAEKRVEGMKARFATVGKSISGFGAALGIGIGVTALAGITRSAFDMASALDESAQKMGVSVEALQHLNLAAEQSGISQESLAGAMAKLNKNMGLLAQGSAPAVAAFAKLGLAAEDLKGKSPEQALGIIADRLNKLPSIQERVAVGAQLMGRGFSELLPLINLGSEGLDKYAEKSRAMGEVTTEEAKRLDELSDSWDRLKVRVGVFAAKFIAMTAEFVSKSDAWLAGWYKTRDGFINATEQLASRVVGYIKEMVLGIGPWFAGRFSGIVEGAKHKIQQLEDAFKRLKDRVVTHSYIPDMVTEIGQEIAKLAPLMVQPVEDATGQAADAFQGLGESIGQSMQALNDNIPLNPLQQWAATVPQTAAQITEAFQGIEARGLDSLSDAIADVVTGTRSLKDAFGDVARSIIADIIRMTVKMLIFRAISSIFGGLFGGGVTPGGPSSINGMGSTGIQGFATGGSMRLGGFGGVDKNLLSLNGSPIARVSKGETMSFSPSNNKGTVINQTFAPNFAGNAATREDLVRMAMMTKEATISAIKDQRRRA